LAGLESEMGMAASQTVPRARAGSDLKNTGHERTTIDHILECGVTLNWKDLTQPDGATSIQVEYRTSSHHSLDYLKLWSSTKRGYWHLISEYWMHSSTGHESGAIFSGGNYSAGLALMLDAIMQHQEAFLPPSSDFLDGLVQIKEPNETDLEAARAEMSRAMDHLGSLTVSHVSLSRNAEMSFSLQGRSPQTD
jgi:hypothetical protein